MLSVKQYQQNLKIYRGFYQGAIDGINGSGTRTACRNFQSYVKITADGIYGQNTENQLLLVIKDLQSKLNNKGYNLVVDGIVGTNTINAVKDFQKKNNLTVDGIAGTNTYTKLNQEVENYKCKYFDKSEFTCKCGCGTNLQKNQIKRVLDMFREKYGLTIITSGTRCVKHNKAVGGVSDSWHLKGNASDFEIPGVSADTLYTYAETLRKQGLIRYTYKITSKAIHIDTGNLE